MKSRQPGLLFIVDNSLLSSLFRPVTSGIKGVKFGQSTHIVYAS